MLKYIIIILDDTSVSFCHYNAASEKRLIPLETLRDGIVFAMKENLNVQFVYPEYDLPKEYEKIIESVDHAKIKPVEKSEDADVIILSNWQNKKYLYSDKSTCTIHSSRIELKNGLAGIKEMFNKMSRLNIVLTDIETFKDEDESDYISILAELSDMVIDRITQGRNVQLNILTDRLLLTNMNNCDAGNTNITLAPNGNFYLCPAFYYDNQENSIGNLNDGLIIKNQQLLWLDHAPICRHCDAFQCKRCLWLNNKLTMDINTPSHQQCVIAHLERNASRYIQQELKNRGLKLQGTDEIEEIDYLDPFKNYKKWQ